MELIKDAGKLSSKISAFGKRLGTMQDELHMLACSAVLHLINTNDPVYINRLTDVLTGAVRVNALKSWFEEFAPVTYNKEKKVFTLNKKRTEGATDKLHAGMVKPFWEFKPEPAYKPLDLVAEIQALIRKANLRVVEGLKEKDKVPMETLTMLQKLVA
jgi:hypothetical protein